MDLSVLKTQLADFGTIVENTIKLFQGLWGTDKEPIGAVDNALALLDGDTWTGFFENTSSAFEHVFSEDSYTSSAIK